MAGIGFALSKLRNQNNLAGHSIATGHAIMITAGPWIVIMIGLALISWLGGPLVGVEMTTTFRVLVIYCFALSLVVTAPIALELNLRVSAELFERRSPGCGFSLSSGWTCRRRRQRPSAFCRCRCSG